MFVIRIQPDFESWRDAARALLRARVTPADVAWADGSSESLLAATPLPPAAAGNDQILVPPQFVEIARLAAHHRDGDRWNLLYRLLHRLTLGGEKHLLEIASDDDVSRLLAMERAVRRDRHKMTAFVRFRKMESVNGEVDGEYYVAWHRPEHYVVRLAADHFVSRFGGAMRFSILTPDECMHFNGSALTFTPGLPRSAAPRDDELEDLWRTYYASTFNPARIKLRAMRKEMPVRHWPTLPETRMIPSLLHEAAARVNAMATTAKIKAAELEAQGIGTSAAEFIPPTHSLRVLRDASKGCRGCPLCLLGSQAVFGEGPADARAIFVGEQPGDYEDQQGRPFVGPAGRVLDEILEEVGVDRKLVYVTNAVKHFKFEMRGKRRIHAKPSAREVTACRPWLEAEIRQIKPPILVCMGATAAQSLLGRQVRITTDRGRPTQSEWAEWTMVTIHPSALLRIPDEQMKQKARAEFAADMKLVARQMKRVAA